MTKVQEAIPHRVAGCALCDAARDAVVWNSAAWRVVRVDDAAFPGYYRVICNHHVVEFSELLAPERKRCMDIVCAVERVLVDALRPTKMNLAAFGNAVPHLHWHVIARFDWDSHYPQPVWGERQRAVPADIAHRLAVSVQELDRRVTDALAH